MKGLNCFQFDRGLAVIKCRNLKSTTIKCTGIKEDLLKNQRCPFSGAFVLFLAHGSSLSSKRVSIDVEFPLAEKAQETSRPRKEHQAPTWLTQHTGTCPRQLPAGNAFCCQTAAVLSSCQPGDRDSFPACWPQSSLTDFWQARLTCYFSCMHTCYH